MRRQELNRAPLMRARSRARTFAVLELPLAQMREVGSAHAATVNDVFMTGLLGGLRTYQERMGVPVGDLPVAFPINVAGDASHDSGNHFSAGVIPGPCSLEDPVERLQAVHDLVAARRAEPGVDAPLRLAPLLHQVPARLATTALDCLCTKGRSTGEQHHRTRLRGLPRRGARSTASTPSARCPAYPLMAVLVSYEGTCTRGLHRRPGGSDGPGAPTGFHPHGVLRPRRRRFDRGRGPA